MSPGIHKVRNCLKGVKEARGRGIKLNIPRQPMQLDVGGGAPCIEKYIIEVRTVLLRRIFKNRTV